MDILGDQLDKFITLKKMPNSKAEELRVLTKYRMNESIKLLLFYPYII